MGNPIARGAVIAAAVAALAAHTAARADDTYAGKKVTITVPAGTGGSFHVYCQLVSQHLGRHIPGAPTIVVINRPGAGGSLSAAYMMSVAPKDGTEIAMIAPGAITAPLVNKFDYDARRFSWLGSMVARSSAIWVWHTKGIRTLADLKAKPVKMGTTGIGSGGSVVPRLMNWALGTRMELVDGYKSGGDVNLAIERDEVDGRWNFRSGFHSVRPDWLKDNKIVAIVASGPRDPHHKDIPHVRDLLPAGSLQQQVYDLVALDFEVGQGFYAPPGTEAKALDILRTAFSRMVADPLLKADIDKRNLELEPLTAPQVEAAMRRGFDIVTPEVLKVFRELSTDDGKKKG